MVKSGNFNRHNHHCPGASGPVDGYPGNCRNTRTHCTTHQIYCNVHDIAYMKSKYCNGCYKAEVLKAKADKQRKDVDVSADLSDQRNGKKSNKTKKSKRKTRTSSSKKLGTKELKPIDQKGKKTLASGDDCNLKDKDTNALTPSQNVSVGAKTPAPLKGGWHRNRSRMTSGEETV